MTLSAQDVRTLEAARKRVVLLQDGLNGLRKKLVDAQNAPDGPLASWAEIQESALTFSRNMDLIQTTFEENREFLTAAHAYPHANFPATKPAGHNIMTELLRKKPEPNVEAWMKEYTDTNRVRRRDTHLDTGLAKEEQIALWRYAYPTVHNIQEEMAGMGAFNYDYTLAEHAEGVARVRTGLRRQLQAKMVREDDASEPEDDDEEMEFEDVKKDEEERDEKMEDVMSEPVEKVSEQDAFGEVKGLVLGGYAMRLDDVCKFLSAGVLPAGR